MGKIAEQLEKIIKPLVFSKDIALAIEKYILDRKPKGINTTDEQDVIQEWQDNLEGKK